MNDRRPFYTKLIYLGIIVALLLPLYLLGRPSAGTQVEVRDGVTQIKYSGGFLAKYRDDNHLSQSSLGKIDPVSESFKLATLGMRPIAVVMLWEKSNYYKKVEDWSNYIATLKQIKLLQPNYIKVWDFLSHGIAFNLSVEFDDWRDRYFYVIQGLQFLIDGTEYNTHNSLLLARIGWFISQKMGKSDDHVHYRERFAKDTILHKSLAEKLEIESTPRDSWLVGKLWYLKAVDAADNHNSRNYKVSEPIFYSWPGMAQIDYANCLEQEGDFDHAKAAWKDAADDWFALGKRLFDDYRGGQVRLNDQEDFETLMKLKDAELARLAGEPLKEATVESRLALVAHAPPAKQAEARRLAEEATSAEKIALGISILRSHVVFGFWKLRCEAEMTPEAIDARKFLYRAAVEFDPTKIPHERVETEGTSLMDSTKRLFEQGFAKWRIVADKYPNLFVDPETGSSTYVSDNLYEDLKMYRKFLALRGETMPPDFVLRDLLDRLDKGSGH